MGSSYPLHIAWALLIGGAVATILGAGLVAAWHFTPINQFQTAREYWQTNPLPRYRLVIERPSLNCQQDVIIHNEQIAEVIEHNCPIELLTMTTLFDRIARLDGFANSGRFPADSCTCQSELHADVVYDPLLYYPSEVTISDRRVVQWNEQNCWRQIVLDGGLPECNDPFLFGQPRVTNISVTPLP